MSIEETLRQMPSIEGQGKDIGDTLDLFVGRTLVTASWDAKRGVVTFDFGFNDGLQYAFACRVATESYEEATKTGEYANPKIFADADGAA